MRPFLFYNGADSSRGGRYHPVGALSSYRRTVTKNKKPLLRPGLWSIPLKHTLRGRPGLVHDESLLL